LVNKILGYSLKAFTLKCLKYELMLLPSENQLFK